MVAVPYRLMVVLLIVLMDCPIVRGAPFVNLNFEQATVPPGTQFFLNASLAFPGWTPRINDTVINTVYYNFTGAGEPAVVLYDTAFGAGGFPVLEGSYSTAYVSELSTPLVASLSQIGDVPMDARSLRLLAPQDRPPPRLFLQGTLVSLVRLSPPGSGNEPALYGADVTPLAGLNIELRLSSLVPPFAGLSGADALSFSTVPIPEPSLTAVLGLGLGMLRRWRAR